MQVHLTQDVVIAVSAPVPGDMKVLISNMGSVDGGPVDTELIDSDNLLVCSVEVKGRVAGAAQETRGYVPADRLMMEEVSFYFQEYLRIFYLLL